MENKYSFLVLCSFLFIHCSTIKVKEQNGLGVENKNVIHSIMDTSYKSNPDSILIFYCNDKKYKIRAKRVSRVYFPSELRNCLLKNGFNGDESANRQIATIIKNTEHFHLHIFKASDAKFRGEEIFETLLDKSQDYRPLNTFEGSDDSKYMEGTVSDIYSAIYTRMIKSIDDFEPYDYLYKAINYREIKTSEYSKDGYFNPEYGVEIGSKIYKAAMEAWLEGKIVFKDYGEE